MKIQKKIKIVTISIFICIAGLFFYISQEQQKEYADTVLITGDSTSECDNSTAEETPGNVPVGEQKKSEEHIFIHVCGAVKKAGVYELKEGSRICDAITVAGGFKKNANRIFLNQAQVLSDGEQIVVPYKDETEVDETKEEAGAGKVSINHATCDELMTLPGIGESKANSIIKYREENGSFQTLEDLKNIQGIKDGVYNKIVDYIML